MRRLAWTMVAMITGVACASAPKPRAKQDEVPIRTDDEIAHDQASSTPVTDPAICKTRPNTLGCPANRGNSGNKKGPFDNAVQRNPRLVQKR